MRDHCRALEPVQVELDRPERDPPKIADQMLADESWRTAGFATDDRSQGRTLRIVGPLVDYAGKDPVPSAITLPERITSANFSPSSVISPYLPPSIRNTNAAVQWS